MKSELQIAAGKLVREIFAVKPGESVVLGESVAIGVLRIMI